MKIAIADDHMLIVSSLKEIILKRDYMELIGQYMSGESLLKGIQQRLPDVLLLDYHLPDQNGAQLARYITYHYPSVKILALTGFDKPNLATEMLESGCRGYLLKATADADLIIEAIHQVHKGQIYLDRSISELYADTIRNNHSYEIDNRPKLTNREMEVLQGIAAELSNQEIADKLFISKRTVENHRNSLMIKAGAKNTVGLIKFAMELKLI